MEVSQKLNTQEIQALLAGLDLITIKGAHARVISNLQNKLEKVSTDYCKEGSSKKKKRKKKLFKKWLKSNIYYRSIIGPKGKWAGNPVTNRS